MDFFAEHFAREIYGELMGEISGWVWEILCVQTMLKSRVGEFCEAVWESFVELCGRLCDVL